MKTHEVDAGRKAAAPASSIARTSRPVRRAAAAIVASALLIVGLVAVPSTLAPAATAMAGPGDVGVEGPSHAGTGTPTGTKRAESVLWFNDGNWWGVLWDTHTSDFHIFRFDAPTQTWVDTNVAADTRSDVHHDVLWDGTTLYVASNRFVNDGAASVAGSPSELRRYSYAAATDTYTWLSTTQINNVRTETLVVDKDSTGRLWATWQQGNRIFLNATSTDGRTWGQPFSYPAGGTSNVSVDDISDIVAYGPGKIGLMWSRQVGDNSDGFYWGVHNDSDPTNVWSAPTPVSTGLRSGDDHLNLKWLDASGGRVFAAVKTSFTSSTDPLIQLLALTGPNTWSKTTIARVSECPNRVILLIDEAQQRLRTFATYPKPSGTTNAGVCSTSGGAVYEKSTPLDNISFSTAKTARIVDADQYVHNVTSTKQNVNNSLSGGRSTTNSGLLVLADVNATKRYWHYYEGPATPGDTTPPTVTAMAPPAGANGVAVDANVTGTFSEPMNPTTINNTTVTLSGPGGTAVPATVTYDDASRTVTLNPNASLANNTSYTTTIVGGASGVRDSANNALAANATWSFTTAVGSPGGTEDVVVTASADSYVSAAATGTNFGTSTVLGVDASPVEVSYLRFDLSPYAGRSLLGATLKVRVSTNGSTGAQNVKLVEDDTWTETGVTFANRPTPLGTVLGSVGPTAKDTDYNIALSPAALAPKVGGPLSLGLDSTSSDGVDIASRETATRPTLVLTLATQ